MILFRLETVCQLVWSVCLQNIKWSCLQSWSTQYFYSGLNIRKIHFSQFFSSQCLLRMGIEYPDYETWSLWTMKTKCDRSADVTKNAQPDILKFSSTFIKKLIWLNKNWIFTQTDFEVVSIPIMCGSLQLDVNWKVYDTLYVQDEKPKFDCSLRLACSWKP